MKSNLNLSIEISHTMDLPADARGISALVARAIATDMLALTDLKATGMGRVVNVGPENGDNVRVFLTGAAITHSGEVAK